MTTLSNRLEECLSPYIDSGQVAGVTALVSDRSGKLAETALGYADIATKKPMSTDSVFWIASQTKPITATAVMMLVDKGLINLDAPIEQYIPAFKDIWLASERSQEQMTLIRPSRSITTRDLLNHTSGMTFASKAEAPTLDRLPLENLVYSYAATPLDNQPGTTYAYSNSGINTAARILEVVTGQPYEDFLSEQLLEPLGMTETTFWPNESQIARIANLYGPNADQTGFQLLQISQLTYPLNDALRYAMPAGGLFSTAADVDKFCRMILNGGEYGGKKFISESSIVEMTARNTAAQQDRGYGLGWGIGEDSFGHGGACSTSMTIYPKIGRIAHFLVQHSGYVGGECDIHDAFQKVAVS